jgi:hypothetical protein
MKLTILVVSLASLMGALLALTLSPQPEPDDSEFVREELLVPGD